MLTLQWSLDLCLWLGQPVAAVVAEFRARRERHSAVWTSHGQRIATVQADLSAVGVGGLAALAVHEISSLASCTQPLAGRAG